MSIVETAQAIAAEGYADVFRSSGEPYINHPARVAARLAPFGHR
jgi:(p)ppGpp synthase/HD superfamily hydrolase